MSATLPEAVIKIEQLIEQLEDQALSPTVPGDVRLTACIRRKQLKEVLDLLNGVTNAL